jgi:hypothetical protein
MYHQPGLYPANAELSAATLAIWWRFVQNRRIQQLWLAAAVARLQAQVDTARRSTVKYRQVKLKLRQRQHELEEAEAILAMAAWFEQTQR